MNNVLLVNPRGGIKDFGSFLDKEKVKCYVVITDPKRNFLSSEDENYYEIYDTTTLPSDLNFVSAISSDVLGFRYMEWLNTDDRIYLKNPKEKTKSRLDSFLIGEPKTDCTVIETFSFNGRHAVSSAWDFADKAYTLKDPKEVTDWNTLVDLAFETLEIVGYINGPAQVFVDSDNKVVGLKYQIFDCMGASLALSLVGKHWLSHWPAVVSSTNNNNKGFFKRYYEWSRSIDNRCYSKLQSYVHKS